MTRIVGLRRTVAPCCQRQYLEPAFASLNFSSSEYWTDGHREASLAPTDGGLRMCSCGHFYTTAEADYLPGIVKDDEAGIPHSTRVGEQELESALKSGRHSPAAETALRRRLWRYWNAGYREAYRELKKHNKDELPPYKPTGAALENLVRLAELLESDAAANAMELCEIYRALGSPQRSRDALALHSSDETENRVAALMRQLLEEGVAGPVRYRL